MARIQRARELTVRAASNVSSDERDAIAVELRAIQDDLAGIANTKHRGRALFAGFENGDAVALVTGGWTYRGDQGRILRQVSEQDRVQANVTAEDVFGFNAGPGADLFSRLDALIAAIDADDVANINAGLGELDAGMDRIGAELARIGSNANRVDSSLSRVQQAELTLRSELSDTEDVDIAEAIMELQLEEVAYQATLGALGRALPQSLLNFLG